jgi:beta-lactamase class A
VRGFHVEHGEAELHRDESLQYRDWFQAGAAVQLLRRIADRSPLTPEHTALLKTWMGDKTRAPVRIGGALPATAVVLHKPGTSGMENGIAAATNDIGLVSLPDGRWLAIAIFVTDSRVNDTARDQVTARIARAIYDDAIRTSVK